MTALSGRVHKSLLKGNYFSGLNVINLNSLLGQIVAHNKYGTGCDY